MNGLSSIQSTFIDNQRGQCIEAGDGTAIASFRSLDPRGLRLTVDTFTRGPLAVNDFVEGTLTVRVDPHGATRFDIDMLDASFGFLKLRMITRGIALFSLFRFAPQLPEGGNIDFGNSLVASCDLRAKSRHHTPTIVEKLQTGLKP